MRLGRPSIVRLGVPTHLSLTRKPPHRNVGEVLADASAEAA